MLKLSDISIRNKLILMQVFTSLLVLGIFLAVFIFSDIRSYKQRKADTMISLARVIGINSISTIRFQDNEAAREILAELHSVEPEISHAAILDKKGKLFATYRQPKAEALHIPDALFKKNYLFTDDELFVTNDIVNDGEKIGKVVLEVELTELQEIKKSMTRMTIILSVIAFGFSFLIALWVQSYLSRRLLNLVNVMKDVSKTGDYGKYMEESGKDEISTLIQVFNNLMQQVKKNQQKKDEFISIASHELKTPLTSIKGYSELLSEIEDRQPHKQFIQKTLEGIDKLEKLIRNLLDVSKIQSGQLELNKREFNINELIDETIAALQMVSKTHRIIREGSLTNGMVLADPQRIEQVMINLLSNAIKYSPGEKMVVVSAKRTNTELIIRVRDYGVGVPREERSNIFERFFRSRETSIHISGFGLGLYICRDIIERHNGRIWLEPEIKGSSFNFSLPIHPQVSPLQKGINYFTP